MDNVVHFRPDFSADHTFRSPLCGAEHDSSGSMYSTWIASLDKITCSECWDLLIKAWQNPTDTEPKTDPDVITKLRNLADLLEAL